MSRKWSIYIEKCHQKIQFCDKFLIWWPLTIFAVSPYTYTLRGFRFFSQFERYWYKTFSIDLVIKFRTFWVEKMTKSVHKQKSYDEFRFLSGLPNFKADFGGRKYIPHIFFWYGRYFYYGYNQNLLWAH